MREVVSVHVGGCGIAVGAAVWRPLMRQIQSGDSEGLSSSGFFSEIETRDGKCIAGGGGNSSNVDSTAVVPRALWLDFDQIDVDRHIKLGSLRGFVDPQWIRTMNDDGCHNFARVFNSQPTREVMDESIRKQIERCDNLDGVVFYHSVAGGAGAAIVAYVLDEEHWVKVPKICFSVFNSSRFSDACHYPYNMMLSIESMMLKKNNLCVVLDNAPLHTFCKENYKIERPSYHHVNSLIAQITATVLSPCMYNTGSTFSRLSDFQQLTTGRYRNFCMPSFANARSLQVQQQQQQSSKSDTRSAQNLVEAVSHPSAILTCEPNVATKGYPSAIPIQHDAAAFFVRGNLEESQRAGITSALTNEHADLFLNEPMWGLNPTQRSFSSCMLANSTSFGPIVRRVVKDLDAVYSWRYFYMSFAGEGIGKDMKYAYSFLTDTLVNLYARPAAAKEPVREGGLF